MISAGAVEKPTIAWPAAKVEIWPIERLTVNPRNARIHGPEQIEQIRASLREFADSCSSRTPKRDDVARRNGMMSPTITR